MSQSRSLLQTLAMVDYYRIKDQEKQSNCGERKNVDMSKMRKRI